jgi:hypothetical protein
MGVIPVEPKPHEVDYWRDRDGCEQHYQVIGGPEEGPDVIPCPALVAPGVNVVHVAMQLDEIEVAALAQGGRLWLTTWGGLPIHLIEVVAPDNGSAPDPAESVENGSSGDPA